MTLIAQPEPTATMSTPLRAGPSKPPRWKIDALRLMALRMCRGPTISLTKTERAGLSKTCTIPIARTSAYTAHSGAMPRMAMSESTRLNTPTSDCVSMSTRRFGNRSAIAPA